VAIVPLYDDPGPRRRFPFVNYALILANIVVFIVEITQGSDQAVGCFQADYSVIPYNILHGIGSMPTDPQLGLASCPPQLAPYTFLPVYVTLITSMFLHANLLHIGGNMLYLWIFGDNVEDRFGHLGYLVFYLFCGLVAGGTQIAATAMLSPGDLIIPNLGASGAIAGVLGAYLLFYPGARVRSLIFIGVFFTITRLRAFIVIGAFFLLQLLDVYLNYIAPQGGNAAAGGVAYFAHIGGFIAGFLITLLLKPFIKAPAAPQTTPAYPRYNG
jgi:membrane associated rhomboid family serine protease